MIQLFGTAISAAWPIWLATIPIALAALVYLFRQRGSSKPQVTATLFLLSRIPEYSPHRRRFVPPLQFWLELALALALALAASGITSGKTGERIAVVIDTSKSMGARVGAYETRLEAAVRLASVDLNQAPSDASFAVYSLGKSLNLLSRGDSSATAVSRSAALQLLNGLRPTYQADNLSDLVRELIARREYDGVWLYTDKRVEVSDLSDRLRVTSVPYDPESVNNVWISSVALRGEERSEIEVRVSRIGGASTEIAVTATCTDRVSGETFTSEPFKHRVPAHSTEPIRLGKLSKPWSYCRIALNYVDGDLLELDDQAWIAHSPNEGAWGVVSALLPEALGVNRLPLGRVVVLSGDDDVQSKDIRGVIYHRTSPSSPSSAPPNAPPHSAAMVVYPDIGVKIWGGTVVGDAKKTDGDTVEISRWDDSHPILRYVRPGLLALPTARVLQCPSTSKPIVYSASGPIICAGEEQGKHYVILGFEVFPFDGLKTATLSILTLNIAHWLSGSAEASGDLTQSSDSADQVTVIAPRQELLALKGGRALDLDQPGVVSIINQNTSPKKERLIAVNTFSDQESDLSLQAPIELGSGAISSAQVLSERLNQNKLGAKLRVNSLRESADCAEICAWCAFLILILDLARRVASRVGWRERI
jgi:hypothetical protein